MDACSSMSHLYSTGQMGAIFARQRTMRSRSRIVRSVVELADPLMQFLELNYPAISEEARVGFAVQIALAERRAEREVLELHHIGAGPSLN